MREDERIEVIVETGFTASEVCRVSNRRRYASTENLDHTQRLISRERSFPLTDIEGTILTDALEGIGRSVKAVRYRSRGVRSVMAPRRHANGHGGALMENGGGVGVGVGVGGINDAMENLLTQNQTTRCCTPTGECLRGDTLIRLNALHDTVKVTCNNESCPIGQFMHRECFDAWEQTVLTYLKSCGRARSWSERQRHQNLWTKKGYDLAFKACGCRCGRGHLKKDLDWMPPGTGNASGNRPDENEAKKKKRRNRQNTRPTLSVSAGPPSHGNHVSTNGRGTTEAQLIESGRGRAGSLSSSTGSSSPPATSEPSVSPLHQPQAIMKKKSKVDFFSDRAR